MGTEIYVLGSILIALAVFLIVAVLMQSGKDKKLSGSIGGGTDTYFGRTKGKSWEKILAIATTVVAVVFLALVVTMYVMIARV